MKPEKSYRIWFTQRNGSTLLCKGLEQTGIAGKPGEYFNLMEAKTLCEKYNVTQYEALKIKIWELGTSNNGVFGIKHSWFTSRSGKIMDEFKTLKNIPLKAKMNEEELLQDLFPNCKHIFLTRRNKVRQAVSWWKAINDQVWHIEKDDQHRNEASFYEKHYDFDALNHLFKEANLRECAIQEYFATNNITPLTFVYEDFIKNFEDTLKIIIDYLEIPHTRINYKEMYYGKTANEQSEKWVQRFRMDLQEKMSEQIW